MDKNYSDFELAINPPYKMEVKIDFPLLKESHDEDSILENLFNLIEKERWINPELERVNILYPQKDRNRFLGYKDSSDDYTIKVKKILSMNNIPVEVVFRDDIFETVHLNRSSHPSLVESFTKIQVYTMPECEFKEGGIFAGESFILLDHCVDKGGTFVNMAGFVEYNGGKVLGALTESFVSMFDIATYSLQQSAPVPEDVSKSFTNLTYEEIEAAEVPVSFLKERHNNKRVKHLAAAFNRSAKEYGKETTPEKCIIAFEKMLNKHGSSVFTLTNKECLNIAHRMGEFASESFINILLDLNREKVNPRVNCPPYSPLI